MMPVRQFLICFLFALSGIACAQGYPAQPVRVIVPFAAGTGPDILARIVIDELRIAMNANFVIDNRVGASGQIAAEIAARAKPDGYTLLLSTQTTHSANPFFFKKLNYDPIKDFAPVAHMINYAFVLLVNPNSGIKTVPELIAYVAANPGKTSYAFGGGAAQVYGAYFAAAAKLDSNPVPYKSTPSALVDLIGKQVDYMFVDYGPTHGYVKAGRLRAIASVGDTPSSVLPDLPAVGATIPGFDVVSWAGMFAPAGTPKAVITRLNDEIVKAINKPTVNQRLREMGLEPAPSSPGEFDEFVKQQLAIWGKKIKDAGIQPE
jgi:tripartite-type tricarboxylate transporter receptor subunit TctC